MSDTDTETLQTYAAVVVFSGWRLEYIVKFLEEELGAQEDQIGLMRIDRTKGEETNRTIMLVKRSLFDDAVAKGFDKHQRDQDFKMTEYEIRDHNKPREGFSKNFFIPIAKNLTTQSFTDQVENKLDILTAFGLFNSKTRPYVKVPLVSRESGDHRGRGFVTFPRNSDLNVVALARVLLNDTRLYTSEDEHHLMGCFWAKEQTHKGKKQKQRPKTGKPTKHGSSPTDSKKSDTKQGSKSKSELDLESDVTKALTEVKPKRRKPKFKPLPKGTIQWSKPLLESTPDSPKEPVVTTETPEDTKDEPVVATETPKDEVVVATESPKDQDTVETPKDSQFTAPLKFPPLST